MGATREDLRQRYVDRIIAVQQSQQSAAGGITPSMQNVQVAIPTGNFTFTNASFTEAQLAKYPKMVAAYSSQSQPTMNISIGSNISNGRILLPGGSRAAYSATMCKYIESCGGINKSPIHSPTDETKIVVGNSNTLNPYGNWLRNDFQIFLEMMLNEASIKLGITKFKLNSGYRSPFYNYHIYSTSNSGDKRVYWSPHMGGYAADISTTGLVQAERLADIAQSLGCGCIGIKSTFVHVDIGPAYKRYHYKE